MTQVEALEQTADLLEQGWCQWCLQISNEDGGEMYCVRGALRQVIYGSAFALPSCTKHLLPLYSVVLGAISREVGVRSAEVALTKWNDTKGRTAIEVVTAVRNAKRFLPES